MNKLKKWLLNINDENSQDYIIQIISINSINQLNDIFSLINHNQIIVLKIKTIDLKQRIKDIVEGYLFACDGYIYKLDSSTILLSKKFKILSED